MNRAVYFVDMPLVISEIMYHPPRPEPGSPYSDNDFEFLELLNTGDKFLDLGGFHFTHGIEFVFPQGVFLEPDGYIVVVKNFEAFSTRYSTDGMKVIGNYDGRLENHGETITLSGPADELILEVAYDDFWSMKTKGMGRSLVPRHPYDRSVNLNMLENWRASLEDGGSPGTDDDVSWGWQVQGDANQDGTLDIKDVEALLVHLFIEQETVLPCGGGINQGGNLTLLDLNDDDTINIADAIYLLAYLYAQGTPPGLGTSCVRIEGCPDVCID
jgi:hypothetical protein